MTYIAMAYIVMASIVMACVVMAELPESLKVLFRPVTVVVPDLELICENMLMAEGFIDAKDLAKKFVTLYPLSRRMFDRMFDRMSHRNVR